MSSRPLLLGGLVVAGAAGYYLYNAGGDPKVAEKQFESMYLFIIAISISLIVSNSCAGDAASASAKVKQQLPGTAKEAKTDAKLLGEKAGAKFDNAVCFTLLFSHPT